MIFFTSTLINLQEDDICPETYSNMMQSPIGWIHRRCRMQLALQQWFCTVLVNIPQHIVINYINICSDPGSL